MSATPHSLVTSVDTLPAGPEWLRALREGAAARVKESGLPTRKTEAWRFTALAASKRPSDSARATRSYVAWMSSSTGVPDFVLSRYFVSQMSSDAA